MPKEHEKIKNLPGEKSLKAPSIAYIDLECIFKKMQYSQNNPKNSYTEKNLSINLQDTHGVQYAQLIILKTNAIVIVIGKRIVLKSYVKI